MPNRITNRNPYVQLIMSVLLGSLIGLLTYFFITALASLNQAQINLNLNVPFHLLLAPIVLLLLVLIRRNTLYFPTKVSDLRGEVSSHYWSWIMAPVHFFGPLLGHAAGMSLGREGAAVLFSSGLVRILKLSWAFWGPVLASIGFSSVIGNYWVAPIFMIEMFPVTTGVQKICGFAGAVAAVTAGQHLGVPHLFLPLEVKDELGFFSKLGLLFLLAVLAGYLMRYYKKLHFYLTKHIAKAGIPIQILAAALVAGFLYLPEFRIYQSLSLSQFQDLHAVETSFLAGLIKLAFTLVCTSIGFLGGEFIPLVFSGVNFGGALFHLFDASSVLGSAFGAFILFAAGTRFKWTAFLLMTFLLGPTWMLWIFFVLTISLNFAGAESLYEKISH